ncbi:hypothetical protein Pelo_3948 [Pelomyxa schiedti]|nr:hypothetical protein Pelo_3948 [Pelomyxa schiedti]
MSLSGSVSPKDLSEAALSKDCKTIFMVDRTHKQILRVNFTGSYSTLISLTGYTDIGGLAMDCSSNLLLFPPLRFVSASYLEGTQPSNCILAIDPYSSPTPKIVGKLPNPTIYFQLLSQYDCNNPSLSQSSSHPSLSSSSQSTVMSASGISESNGDSSDTLLSQQSSSSDGGGKKGMLGLALGLGVGLGVPLIAGCAAGLIMFFVWRGRNGGGSDLPEEAANVMEMTPLSKMSDLSRYDKSLSLDPSMQVAVEKFPLEVTPHSVLDFELGTHQAPVGTEMKQTITLTNNTSRSPVAFKVMAPKSHQYTLQFSESSATLKQDEEMEVVVSLTVLCTTTINTDVIIMAHNNKAEPQNFVVLKIAIDSMISTSLDHEELRVSALSSLVFILTPRNSLELTLSPSSPARLGAGVSKKLQ